MAYPNYILTDIISRIELGNEDTSDETFRVEVLSCLNDVAEELRLNQEEISELEDRLEEAENDTDTE